MKKAMTEIESEHAAKYLVTLCRHFARKVSADWDEKYGEVNFPAGTTKFAVNEEETALTIQCEADSDEKLEIQKAIITGHVDLFSRREKIQLNWTYA
ncbi:hypothetical protein GCE9029_03540 [Grimontia celer]|uniref:DUF2218 domain-containing protein n=1 Tax=Grimontia celer TaxID=1796497 RepID=A0A128F841_9GAMM|nr:DUF2218 domain-containing protein [Grimontia celer]CZF82949.1 hypothetical protein GCE9029_03540 [Grimontia celer]